MNKADFGRLHLWFTAKMKTIWDAKNKDYTGEATDNPFVNFSRGESMGITTEQAIGSRMADKFGRIETYIKTGALQVKEEAIENDCIDLANYCVALAAWFRHKQETVKKVSVTYQSLVPGRITEIVPPLVMAVEQQPEEQTPIDNTPVP